MVLTRSNFDTDFWVRAFAFDTALQVLTGCRQTLERLLILIMWNDTDTPLAYLISFRSYGTWLHGDRRGAINRFHNNYGEPYLPPNTMWQEHIRNQMKTHPLILGATERGSVEKAIRETCQIRKWTCMPAM